MPDMTPEAATALREPFPPSAVGRLPKRNKNQDGSWGATVYLDYVGHAAVTDRLLKVDPNWTWEPVALDQVGLPALDRDGNLWIRLTICGVTRLGVGDGKSMKERIGDAIRNAAMRFGVALDLWSKEDLHDMEQASHGEATPVQTPPPPPPVWVEQVTSAIRDLPEPLKTDLREWYVASALPIQFTDLTQAQATTVLDHIAALRQNAAGGSQDPR